MIRVFLHTYRTTVNGEIRKCEMGFCKHILFKILLILFSFIFFFHTIDFFSLSQYVDNNFTHVTKMNIQNLFRKYVHIYIYISYICYINWIRVKKIKERKNVVVQLYFSLQVFVGLS